VGSLPQFVANLLPLFFPLYRVRPDPAAAGRWIVSAQLAFEVTYDPGQLVLTGLAFTGSAAASGDLTVFAENRNPAAYTVLAGAPYPWSLPFDVFTEEVRACLATIGTTRRDLIRASARHAQRVGPRCVRDPEHHARRSGSLTDPDPAASSASWGLLVTGNTLSEPTGDTSAPPIPGDWVGALSRLSVLLQRSRVELPTLLGTLASRYVTGGATPDLQPHTEDKPGRLTVQGVSEGAGALHRFRGRLITGWPLRDLDLALAR
jgi:hypothetical protein